MLLIALWVRSYYHYDQLIYANGVDWAVSSSSTQGHWIVYNYNSDHSVALFESGWLARTFPIEKLPKQPVPPGLFRMFQLRPNEFVMPYWFPVMLTCILATVLGIRRPYRFRLRTMLVATAIIAAWFGLIISLI